MIWGYPRKSPKTVPPRFELPSDSARNPAHTQADGGLGRTRDPGDRGYGSKWGVPREPPKAAHMGLSENVGLIFPIIAI